MPLPNGELKQLRNMPVAMLAMWEVGLVPTAEYPGAAALWECVHTICGNTITVRYNDIQTRGRPQCRYCTVNKRIDPDDASVFMRSKGFDPLTNFLTVNTPWECVHIVCENKVTPRYSKIKAGRVGCPHCTGKCSRDCDCTVRKGVVIGRFSLEREEAVALMRSKGFEPLERYPGSTEPWSCTHTVCGNAVSPTYFRIRAGKGGCLHCIKQCPLSCDCTIRKGTVPGHTKIKADEAAEFMRSKNLEPLVSYSGADDPWPCTHTVCGGTTSSTYASIRIGRRGCAHCAQSCPLDCDCSVRKAAAVAAAEYMRSRNFEPLAPYPGPDAHWSCTHTPCGSVGTPVYATIRWGSGGCRHCAGLCPRDCECSVRQRLAGRRV